MQSISQNRLFVKSNRLDQRKTEVIICKMDSAERKKILIGQKNYIKKCMSNRAKLVSEDDSMLGKNMVIAKDNPFLINENNSQIQGRSPYKGDKIYLMFDIPANYPNQEPVVHIKDPERFMHPNIDDQGRICYFGDIVPGSNLNLGDRINLILDRLSNPNPTDFVISKEEASDLYMKNKEKWFKKSEEKFMAMKKK